MAATQQQVLADHDEEIRTALQFVRDQADTDAAGQHYVRLWHDLHQAARGQGPELSYEHLQDVRDAVDAGVDAVGGSADEARWQDAADAIAELLDQMQVEQLRWHVVPIYDALDVAIDGADTPEESKRPAQVKDLLRRGKKLQEDDLRVVERELIGGVDAFEGDPREEEFEAALIAVRRALEVVPSGTPRSPQASQVADALQAINEHRRQLRQAPLDPSAAGWSEDDVLLEAERVRRLPNPVAALKASLMP